MALKKRKNSSNIIGGKDMVCNQKRAHNRCLELDLCNLFTILIIIFFIVEIKLNIFTCINNYITEKSR